MLADELKQLFDSSLKANAQLLVRAGGVLKEAAQAARDPKQLSNRDSRALLGDLAKLQLDYLRELSRGSTQYWTAVLALAESAVGPNTAPTGSAAANAQALYGRAGGTVAFQFQIDNPNAEPVSARIEAQPWVGRGGETVDAQSMVFQPADMIVAPHDHAVVLGRVVLDDRFAQGQTYDTIIRVAGFPGRQVSFSLTVARQDT